MGNDLGITRNSRGTPSPRYPLRERNPTIGAGRAGVLKSSVVGVLLHVVLVVKYKQQNSEGRENLKLDYHGPNQQRQRLLAPLHIHCCYMFIYEGYVVSWETHSPESSLDYQQGTLFIFPRQNNRGCVLVYCQVQNLYINSSEKCKVNQFGLWIASPVNDITESSKTLESHIDEMANHIHR